MAKQKYRSDLKIHKISVKVSERDYDKLHADAKRAGVNVSEYIRELIQGAGSIDTTYAVDRANFIRQISGVATNVNQVAKRTNEQGHVYFGDLNEMMQLLTEIKEQMKEVIRIWQLQKS